MRRDPRGGNMVQVGQVVTVEGRGVSARPALVLEVRHDEEVANPVLTVVYADAVKQMLTDTVTMQPIVRHAVVYKYDVPHEPVPWRWWDGDPKSLGGL
jgi:hypothetical protein